MNKPMCPRCRRSSVTVVNLTIVPCGCTVRRCASCAEDAVTTEAAKMSVEGTLIHHCGKEAPADQWRVERGAV